MTDVDSLLATLSQSSAAMVAIIGGFLVSRLVALSSEREGIKRQLKATRERLVLHRKEYEPLHADRLERSIDLMEEWLLDKLTDEREQTKELPTSELMDVPRGSTYDELLPYANEFREKVESAYERVLELVNEDDTSSLDLDDLRERGLKVADDETEVFESVVSSVTDLLPSPYQGFGSIPVLPNIRAITPGWSHEIDARRLDEAIRAESDIAAQIRASEHEIERLENDLDLFAQPVGVAPAVWILALFSALGIVAPLGFMAFGPSKLDTWIVVALLSAFVVGLGAVLVYIMWYQRKVSGSEEKKRNRKSLPKTKQIAEKAEDNSGNQKANG